MTDTPTPRVIIRYKNRARALVTVTEHAGTCRALPQPTEQD